MFLFTIFLLRIFTWVGIKVWNTFAILISQIKPTFVHAKSSRKYFVMNQIGFRIKTAAPLFNTHFTGKKMFLNIFLLGMYFFFFLLCKIFFSIHFNTTAIKCYNNITNNISHFNINCFIWTM